MSRFGRCQREDCRKKWHRISMTGTAARRVDLLDVPREACTGEVVGYCPACGGECHAEKGFTEEADAARPIR